MADEVLRFESVIIKAGNFTLHKVDLSVYNNEIFAVLGRTGSGKTLMLEAAAGLLKPYSGRVVLDGTDVTRKPIHKRNIGFLYQDYSLFPHMTVKDNISYGLKSKKLPKAEIDEKVKELAEAFNIEHLLKDYPGTLSGGERQRTALARALIVRPRLLLLDEPFSAIDPATRVRFYDLLKQVHKDYECAIILVTHNFNEAKLLADRIGVILDGEMKGIVRASGLFEHNWDPETRAFLGLQCDQHRIIFSNSNLVNSQEMF